MTASAPCWVCAHFFGRQVALVQVTDNGRRVEYCPVCHPELTRLLAATTRSRVVLLKQQHPDWSACRIAEEVGIHPRRVYEHFHAAGIPVRPRRRKDQAA